MPAHVPHGKPPNYKPRHDCTPACAQQLTPQQAWVALALGVLDFRMMLGHRPSSPSTCILVPVLSQTLLAKLLVKPAFDLSGKAKRLDVQWRIGQTTATQHGSATSALSDAFAVLSVCCTRLLVVVPPHSPDRRALAKPAAPNTQ